MTERERLIEILSQTIYPRDGIDPVEAVADHLLDNGVRPQRNGKFVQDEETGEYICSECGHNTCGYFDMEDEAFGTVFGKGFRLRQPHYCKHCGAKMDEVEE